MCIAIFLWLFPQKCMYAPQVSKKEVGIGQKFYEILWSVALVQIGIKLQNTYVFLRRTIPQVFILDWIVLLIIR